MVVAKELLLVTKAPAKVLTFADSDCWLLVTPALRLPMLVAKELLLLTNAEAKEIRPKVGFGMEKKILAATEALDMGVTEALIGNGQRENPISSAIAHTKCTVITK